MPGDQGSFAERARTAGRVNDLLSLADTELSDIVLGADDALASAACDVLLGRLAGIVERASGVTCVRLAHLGRHGECSRHRCHEAFPSARAEFAGRTVGRYYGSTSGTTRRFVEMEPDRRPRVAKRTSVVHAWTQRSDRYADRELAAFVHADLHARGRTTDARRRWNKDRGLIVRINMPPNVIAAADRLIADDAESEVLRVAASSSIGLDVRAWAVVLYDDACETAPDERPVYHHRVARAVGLPSDTATVSEVVERAIDAVDAIIEEACTAVDSDLYDRSFSRARALTRQLGRDYDRSYDESDDIRVYR